MKGHCHIPIEASGGAAVETAAQEKALPELTADSVLTSTGTCGQVLPTQPVRFALWSGCCEDAHQRY